MNKLVIANWKANPRTLDEAQALAQASKAPGVIVCPPSIYIAALKPNGAQDVFWEGGPHTGQVSPTMLVQFGVTHVLVGHSERRAVGETDEQINNKLKALLQEGMTPVLLIGEPEKGPARSDYLIDQLTRDLEGISNPDAQKILYTYEPVWAISTNAGHQADTPEGALEAITEMQGILQKMHGFAPAMLYGGSVNEKNVGDFLKHPEICGAVVGGASLRIEEFKNMIKIVSSL